MLHPSEMVKTPQPPPPKFRKTFIREWRTRRGLTLEQVAERVGNMAPSNLSMLERGQRGYTQDTLEKIAAALQTNVAALLSRAPGDDDAIWTIWGSAKPAQRRQILEIAKTITRIEE